VVEYYNIKCLRANNMAMIMIPLSLVLDAESDVQTFLMTLEM
jgi:hypothetical protein